MPTGEGGVKRFFPPTKDIGTRVGEQLGMGKYFPTNFSKKIFIF